MDRTPAKPLRVLLLIARLNIGGPAVQVLALSRSLAADGHQSRLVCGKVSPGEGDMAYLAEDWGVRPHVIGMMGREISFRGDLRSLFRLRRIIATFKPHIIHTHTAKAGFLGRLAGMSVNLLRSPAMRIRMIHTFHGHTFHSYFGRLKTALFIGIERLLARFTDRIVVISRQQKEDICRTYRIAGPGKATVIPLGFDLSPYLNADSHSQRARRSCTPDTAAAPLSPYRAGIIGRLAPVKNHRLLLAAIEILKRRGCAQGFRFIVVGDGELRRALEEEIDIAGTGDVIAFTGWQREMAPVYRALDAVVLASDNEGTPVTLIEAMAAGVPVVATAVGGVPDLLGEVRTTVQDGICMAERGMLVQKGNAEALAQALVYMYGHREEADRMAVAAREHVRRVYALARFVTDTEALYSEVACAPRV